MLRVLSGTQRGWMGKLALNPGFIAAMHAHAAQPHQLITPRGGHLRGSEGRINLD